MDDIVEEILTKIEELESHYNECFSKALDKGNINAAQIHAAEASAFILQINKRNIKEPSDKSYGLNQIQVQ